MKSFDIKHEKPRKVRIQEPEVSSVNLIPTNKENKAYQTSTHFPSSDDMTTEADDTGDDETKTEADNDDFDNTGDDDDDETKTEADNDDFDNTSDDETKTKADNDDFDENENPQNIDILNIDSTQTDQLSFMDEYGHRFASFFGDM